MNEPNLFAYEDYRKYLADWLVWKQASGKYSMRAFAKRSGFGAPNILRLVIDGKRNLSARSIGKFATELKLDESSRAYFETLVCMNQADTMTERMSHYQRLVRHPMRRKAAPLEQAKLRFLRHWLAPIIYEMTHFPDFQADAAWIAAQFDPAHSIADVRRAMADLIAVGLVEENEDGSWVRLETDILTGDGVRDMHMFAYHENALAKAADALLDVPMNERSYQVIITAGSRNSLPKIKKWWQESQAELLALVESEDSPKDEVFQISWQLFPLVRKKQPQAPG